MKHVVANGRLRGGQLFVNRRQEFDALLKTWRDCPVKVTVERLHATRSLAQNSYYHTVVVPRCATAFAKAMKRSVSDEEAHELLKVQFLPHYMAAEGTNGTLINGLVIGGSTTKLNKLQFIEYLEAIVGWAAEKWDVYIPDPDPEWRQHAEAEAA